MLGPLPVTLTTECMPPAKKVWWVECPHSVAVAEQGPSRAFRRFLARNEGGGGALSAHTLLQRAMPLSTNNWTLIPPPVPQTTLTALRQTHVLSFLAFPFVRCLCECAGVAKGKAAWLQRPGWQQGLLLRRRLQHCIRLLLLRQCMLLRREMTAALRWPRVLSHRHCVSVPMAWLPSPAKPLAGRAAPLTNFATATAIAVATAAVTAMATFAREVQTPSRMVPPSLPRPSSPEKCGPPCRAVPCRGGVCSSVADA
eukprot:365581-Chlamydomonas_euryale.AAC.5